MNRFDIFLQTPFLVRKLDALGRVTAATDPLGTFAYGYVGGSNRLAQVNYPASLARVMYSYYPATSDGSDGNGDFRLKEIANLKTSETSDSAFSRFSYRYDRAGNITQWTQDQESGNRTWGLEYDGADPLTGVNRTAITPELAGDVAKAVYGYDPAGNRTLEERDGQAVGAKFNGLNQTTSRDTGKRTGFAGTSDVEAKVTVGGVGAAVAPEGGAYRWKTDLVLRDGPQTIPVEAENAAGEKRRYEIQMEVTGAVAASPESFTYDDNGNLTAHSYSLGGQATTTTYDWDASNRLIGVTTGNVRSLFGYNGRGQRVRQIEQSRVSANAAWTTSDDRTLIWNGAGLKCERSTSTGGELIRHWANGWQTASGTPVTFTSYYYLRDHLGSVREVVNVNNGSTVVQARYSYDAWGRVTRLPIDGHTNLGTVESPLGYTGHYRHLGTGLHLAFYPAYDAELGRWVNRDPIGERGGLNIYDYVENRPIDVVDPLGLMGCGHGNPIPRFKCKKECEEFWDKWEQDCVLTARVMTLCGAAAGGWVNKSTKTNAAGLVIAVVVAGNAWLWSQHIEDCKSRAKDGRSKCPR